MPNQTSLLISHQSSLIFTAFLLKQVGNCKLSDLSSVFSVKKNFQLIQPLFFCQHTRSPIEIPRFSDNFYLLQLEVAKSYKSHVRISFIKKPIVFPLLLFQNMGLKNFQRRRRSNSAKFSAQENHMDYFVKSEHLEKVCLTHRMIKDSQQLQSQGSKCGFRRTMLTLLILTVLLAVGGLLLWSQIDRVSVVINSRGSQQNLQRIIMKIEGLDYRFKTYVLMVEQLPQPEFFNRNRLTFEMERKNQEGLSLQQIQKVVSRLKSTQFLYIEEVIPSGYSSFMPTDISLPAQKMQNILSGKFTQGQIDIKNALQSENSPDFKIQASLYNKQSFLQAIKTRKQPQRILKVGQGAWRANQTQQIQMIMEYEKKLNEFSIPVEQIEGFGVASFNKVPLSEYGLDKSIQIGSVFDYLHLTLRPQFSKVHEWEKTLPYVTYNFTFNQSLQKQQAKLDLQHFTNVSEAKKYLAAQYNKQNTEDLDFELGALLTAFPDDPLAKEAEYLMYDSKYNIGSSNYEIPMCIFASGFNIASKNRYSQFFQSIERQNYTNYRLIVVDDSSTDNTVPVFESYLGGQNFRLNNRLTVVKNVLRLGSVGNLYTRIRQFCNQDQIVVNVDSDDQLIGSLALQVFNKIYQNKNTWVAYSHINTRQLQTNKNKMQSYDFRDYMDSFYYRTSRYWGNTGIKTYRKSLLSKVPIEYSIEYHYNALFNRLEPHFYDSASDRFMMYPLIEMSGYERVQFITSSIYCYNNQMPKQQRNNCYREHQHFDEYKARMKTPLNRLDSMSSNARPVQNYAPRPGYLVRLHRKYNFLAICRSRIMEQSSMKLQSVI